MSKAMLMLMLVTSSAWATEERMVWKVVSSSGLVSATVYNDLKECKKALRKYKAGSTCVAVPVKKS